MYVNGSQLAKMKKQTPYMSLPGPCHKVYRLETVGFFFPMILIITFCVCVCVNMWNLGQSHEKFGILSTTASNLKIPLVDM